LSFLRGKSTSFSIWPVGKETTIEVLPALVNTYAFTSISEDETEATGFCSWRNLLDGPIDSGFLEGTPNLWMTGLRKDVKRAPAALVTAETARAIADYMQLNPGNPPSKETIKTIGAGVRDKLNKKAQARPSHGAAMIDTDTGLLYFEGPASAAAWTMPKFGAIAPLFADASANGRFLLWLAFLSTQNEVDSPCSLNGSIAFATPGANGKLGKGVRATFDGTTTVTDLLERWVIESKGRVMHLGTMWSVMMDGGWEVGIEAVLHANALKVTGLVFPEDILEAPGSVEERLALRMSCLTAFSKTVAEAFSKWGVVDTQATDSSDLSTVPEGYKKLLAALA
jgi:hypothetical protein